PEAGELLRCDAGLEDCTHLPLCQVTGTVAVSGDTVAVTCPLEGQLVLLSGDDIRRIDLGTGTWPFGVVGRGGRWWVTLQGTDAVAQVSGDTVVGRLPTVPNPRGLALDPDDRIYVGRWRSDADGAEIAVMDDDGVDRDLRIPVDPQAAVPGVLGQLEQLALSPDGRTLLVPAVQSNVVEGSTRTGTALEWDRLLRGAVVAFDLDDDGRATERHRVLLEGHGRVASILAVPDAGLLLALDPGTATLLVLDADTLDLRLEVSGLGDAPMGMAMSPDGATVYIQSWLSRQLLALDLGPLHCPGAPGDDDGPCTPPTLGASVPLSDFEPLSDEALRGKRLFWTAADPRISAGGTIACAHCHPDGQDDGLVWDFTDRGEGLRRTQSLLGVGTGADTADPATGLGTGRLHWTGNFDEIQDFEGDMRGAFGGTGMLAEDDWDRTQDSLGPGKAGLSDDLDALARFVHSLRDPLVSPFPRDDAAASAFDAAGCAECHPPPRYTDSSRTEGIRHDIGTLSAASGQRLGRPLDGLDTPSLVGTWARGPWLHDGSAATVREAIAAHDSAAELDDETLDLLAAFCLAL
ncbi:MAG: hypothetical protein D6798_15580, partial [Deltaproteobacteria bacterium]